MPRILGIEIPSKKRIVIALTYVHGIGKNLAVKILDLAKISHHKKSCELSSQELSQMSRFITENFVVEGDLRSKRLFNIKRLKEIGCRRGRRHRENRKLRGQKTKNSGRMIKSKKRPIANKNKVGK